MLHSGQPPDTLLAQHLLLFYQDLALQSQLGEACSVGEDLHLDGNVVKLLDNRVRIQNSMFRPVGGQQVPDHSQQDDVCLYQRRQPHLTTSNLQEIQPVAGGC